MAQRALEDESQLGRLEFSDEEAQRLELVQT